ncbi:MAG: hypothetical protein RIT26_1012 [Pseudomonadota bacterium]|jgi:hypothetical protein
MSSVRLPIAHLRRLALQGFGWVESMLALVVFSVVTGALIQVWVKDHEMQRVQRQADVLQTARLASQRLVSLYRRTLAFPVGIPLLLNRVDGSTLTSPITGSASGGYNTWVLTQAQLIDLQILDGNFPGSGVYGSLINAQLQLNLTASQSSQKITGTLCYNQPLLKDGQADLSALGALQAQVSRSSSAVSAGTVNNTSHQSGVFVASYPGDGAHLKGSASGINIANPIAGSPEGVVCALVGDWGGLENTGRTAYPAATLNGACTETHALAWLTPDSTSSQPTHALWCNGSQWKLFQGAQVGDTCNDGAMGVDANASSATYLQPLMCGPSNTMVAGRMVPLKENLTCDNSNLGILAIGKADQKIYRCQSVARASNKNYNDLIWNNDFYNGGRYQLTRVQFQSDPGASIPCDATAINSLGYRTSNTAAVNDFKLLICWGGNWSGL